MASRPISLMRGQTGPHSSVDFSSGFAGSLLPVAIISPRAPPFSYRHAFTAVRATQRADVYESLTLLGFPSEVPDESISEAVDQVWSLQYQVAGVLCGSAGPLISLTSYPNLEPPFSHAVLFRYGKEATRNAFLSHPRTINMLGQTTAAAGSNSVVTLQFSVFVPNELEAIFQRGGEWAAGYEFMAGLAEVGGNSTEDVLEFLNLTQQLASSSAFGAVQSCAGRCTDVTMDMTSGAATEATPPALTRPEYMLTTRFETKEQLDAFVACPPLTALLQGDERAPLRALWATALQIAPAENSRTSPPQTNVPKL